MVGSECVMELLFGLVTWIIHTWNKLSRLAFPFITAVLFVGPHPCFRLLVTLTLSFKARVDPLLLCFVTCAQWVLQIHL